MTGTHYIPPILLDADTAVLHAVNLQKGDYTFQLTVTDSAGHTSSDSTAVHVIDTGSCLAAKPRLFRCGFDTLFRCGFEGLGLTGAEWRLF